MKIKIICIGHVDKLVNLNYFQNFKSNFFQFHTIESIQNLPQSSINNGYLNIVYTKNDINTLLSSIKFDGLCLALMPYAFNDDFYMHRITNNKVCISLAGIDEILSYKDISIENFIIKNIYEIFLFYKILNTLESDNVYLFVHQDTRKCLFDMNGDKTHILYNTEKPIICDECKSKIKKYPIENEFLDLFEKELSKIKKPLLKRIELFIRKYPLFSILLTIILSVSVNLFSNFLWELIK